MSTSPPGLPRTTTLPSLSAMQRIAPTTTDPLALPVLATPHPQFVPLEALVTALAHARQDSP